MRKLAVILACFIALPALAQTRTPTPRPRPALTGNPIADVQNALSGGAATATSADNAILKALAKPLQDLAAFIGEDNAGAITLSAQIPNLQDLNGKACWMAMSDTAAVFKAHPVPLTFKVMQDVEAHRLLVWSAYNLCHNTACGIVFNDMQAEATALSGGISVPNVYQQICSRISGLAAQLPASALPPAVTAPAAPTSAPTAPAAPASPNP